MKKFFIASALMLSGCATLTPVATPTTCTSTTVIDNKAYYAAEAVYNVPAQAYVSAVKAGSLSGTKKDDIKALLLKARGYRNLVRSAHDSCAFDNLVSLASQIKTMLGVK